MNTIRIDDPSRILCIAVHPDDETLGCGGTLVRHRRLGESIHWLILTRRDTSVGFSTEQIIHRQEEIREVAQLIGFSSVSSLDYPCTRLDRVPFDDLIRNMVNVLQKIRPDVIYLPNRSDIHSDHRVAFEAIIAATKSFRCPFVRRMMMYECLSETEMAPPLPETAFIPNVYVDISRDFHIKQKAMTIYRSELMDSVWPRSLEVMEALARFRGSRIGVSYAESFMLIYEAFRE